jgi:penicillin-binding protein 2
VDPAVEGRLPLLAALIILTFAAFAVRLFQLQIIESADLRLRSQRNSVRTVRLEAPRGDVMDREGRVLATTRPAFGLQVIPHDLRHSEVTFAALGMLLDEDGAALRTRVGSPRGRQRFAPVRLAGDLSYDRRARVESHLYALPGVVTDARPRRYYPGGSLASHLLGSIGEIGREQLVTREFADYRQGEVIGQTGIEARYQAHLRGRAGGRNQVVDVSGRVVEVLDDVEPQPGGSVTLTLDLDLQNGDVLALVSKPSYDPNAFAGGVDAATWHSLTSDEWRPLQNRALAGVYPPGSTYKAIVAAAGLQEGVIDPDEPFYCPGSFKLGRRTYRCWKRQGHGEMNLHDALVQSCDVYFYRVGLELGIDRLAFYANGFNLGRRSRIGLPQEKSGLVPTRAWKEKRYAEPWIRGETVSASIGQGYNLVTPLQLTVAFAGLATGGELMRPRLLLRKTGRDGSVTERRPPELRGTLPVAPEHLARIRDALEGVVGEPRGTGGRARIRGVRVAGKTGTVQVVRLEHTEGIEEDEVPFRYRDHAWFVGFAPVEAPEIVVAAIVEHGGHGGSAAAPIVRRVLERYFEKRKGAEALRVAEAPEAGLAND